MKLIRYIFTLLILQMFCVNSYAHEERWDEDKSQWSGLMIAIYEGENEKVKNLIANGSEINQRITGPFKLNAVEVAIRKGNEIAFNLLLDTDSVSDIHSYIRLASAYESGLIMDKIILNGGNVNDTLANGHSVLMYATSFGSLDVLESLLKNGANVHQTRKTDNWNALLLAAHQGDIKKVKLLLQYGADKNFTDKNGKRPYDLIDYIYERYHVSQQEKEELKKLLK